MLVQSGLTWSVELVTLSNLIVIFHVGKEEVGITFGIACAQSRARREITLPTKVRIVKAMISLVVMYDCERWTIKKVESESDVAQSCPTLCNPMECSLPVSSVHGIFQTRILEWVAISFSRGSSQPRHWTLVSCIASRLFTIWATREAPKEGGAPKNQCLWTVVLEKTTDSPLDNRRSNQSILRGINPEYLLERLMLKLKLQHFGHVLWTADSLEKSVMLGKIEGRKRRGHQRMRGGWMASPMRWTWTWANFRRWWGTEGPGVLLSMGLQRVRHDWVTEQQQRSRAKGQEKKGSGSSCCC